MVLNLKNSEAISHGPAPGSNTRCDGLCVSFKAANFDSQLADFKALNHETLTKFQIEIIILTNRKFNLIIPYVDSVSVELIALKTKLSADSVE